MSTPAAKLDHAGKLLGLHTCSICGYSSDAATCVTESTTQRPSPGDFTLCLKCGELYVFDDKMRLQTPSIAWLVAAGNEVREQIGLAQRMIRQMRPKG